MGVKRPRADVAAPLGRGGATPRSRRDRTRARDRAGGAQRAIAPNVRVCEHAAAPARAAAWLERRGVIVLGRVGLAPWSGALAREIAQADVLHTA